MENSNAKSSGRPGRSNPEQMRERLRALRGSVDGSQWDIAEELDAQEIELGKRFNRKQASDDLGVLPGAVGDMLLTVRRAGHLRHDPRAVDVPFSAWVYIARDEKPDEFFNALLESMDSYGGTWPGVRVIRELLAERKGKPRKSKPESTAATLDELYRRDGKFAAVYLVDEAEVDGWRVGESHIITRPEVAEPGA